MDAKRNNYDDVREQWRLRFLEMDCEALARRFHLELDEKRLYLTYFSRSYGISRETGEIARLDKPEIISFNTAMNFYNMFYYAGEHPVASGRLVPFREVKRVYPFERAYRDTILRPLQKRFEGRTDALRRALAALKARPLSQGDASGSFDVFPGLRIAVIFWDGDDEFPAQMNMLFDSNITDFMHEENVVCVASDAARFLTEEAQLSGEAVGY